jgi:transcriptional regulator with XRE-family HTH domain
MPVGISRCAPRGANRHPVSPRDTPWHPIAHEPEMRRSQEGFADACHLRRTHISLLERGRLDVKIATLRQIARVLGIILSQLFRRLSSATCLSLRLQPVSGLFIAFSDHHDRRHTSQCPFRRTRHRPRTIPVQRRRPRGCPRRRPAHRRNPQRYHDTAQRAADNKALGQVRYRRF